MHAHTSVSSFKLESGAEEHWMNGRERHTQRKAPPPAMAWGLPLFAPGKDHGLYEHSLLAPDSVEAWILPPRVH